MAKNVIINGVVYSNVPSVNIPLSDGNGKAVFVDTSSGNAVSGDMRNGKKSWVNGAEVTGSIPEKSAADVTASGKTVSVPAGIYDEPISKNVADGAVTPSATVTGDVVGDAATDYEIDVIPSAAVTPGYVSNGKAGEVIKKYIQTESKTVAPATTQQNIAPSPGKLLHNVYVAAVDMSGTATEADVMNGKTFFSGNSLVRKVGSATVPTIGQDSATKILTIV